MARKKAIHDCYEMKERGEKVTWLTAYDFPTNRVAETAGPDMPFMSYQASDEQAVPPKSPRISAAPSPNSSKML